MKKVFKTLFIYLGVILLACVATVVFCAGFLFFYRDGNIFGIKYITANELMIATEDEDMSQLKTIEVYSSGFEVNVRVNPNVETLKGAMKNKVFGYAKKSKAQASFNLEYNETTKTAVFTSVQPSGWLNKKGSYIEIAIPEYMADDNVDLKVVTTSGDIGVGNDYDLRLANLDIQTGKGEAIVKNIELTNSINVKVGKGLVGVDSSCITSGTVDASISVNSGTVDLTKIDPEKFSLGIVNIDEIVKGKIGIRKADELKTDGNIRGGGYVCVTGEVGIVDFASLDTDLEINKISSSTSNSRVAITGNGDIEINEANCNLTIDGHNGDVYLNNIRGITNVFTNHGDVKMYNALKTVNVETAYGNAEINFSDVAGDYSTLNNDSRNVIAQTKNGHIIVNGLQHGRIIATDKGRISLEYNKVVGENIISANIGVVNIVVPNSPLGDNAGYAFNLTVKSEVNTDVKVGVVGSLGEIDYKVNHNQSGEHTFSNIYGNAGSNNLKVETSAGIIKIRSRDLINF